MASKQQVSATTDVFVQDAGPVFEHPDETGGWKKVRGASEVPAADARVAVLRAAAPTIFKACIVDGGVWKMG